MDLFSAKSLYKPLFLFNGGATNQDVLLFANLWYAIDLHLVFETSSLTNLIFCLVKVKGQTRQKIKFIKLDFSNTIVQQSSADQ